MEFTVVVKKGEKQFVALCPEVDVVSQGTSIEKAIENLKEAVALYVEEMGLPQLASTAKPLVTSFTLTVVSHKKRLPGVHFRNAKASTSVG